MSNLNPQLSQYLASLIFPSLRDEGKLCRRRYIDLFVKINFPLCEPLKRGEKASLEAFNSRRFIRENPFSLGAPQTYPIRHWNETIKCIIFWPLPRKTFTLARLQGRDTWVGHAALGPCSGRSVRMSPQGDRISGAANRYVIMYQGLIFTFNTVKMQKRFFVR